MLSILVCHSYFLRFDSKQVQRAKPYPPLATLQVAGMLRQAGHQVALFDAMLATGLEEYDLTLAEVYEAADLIREGTDAEDANIIFGTVVDPRLQGAVRITVLATGFDARPPRKNDPPFHSHSAKEKSEPEPARVPANNDIDIPAFLRRR